MITYQHELYIEQAINGVLMQQTDFNIELIIADDCSPDNTKQVVERILANNNDANISYYKHDKNKGISDNFEFACKKVQGDFIAICEGDDFWTNKNKLQIQYDFLTKHKDVNLVCTDKSVFIQESRKTINPPIHSNRKPQIFSFEQTMEEAEIATLTVMIRSEIIRNYMYLRSQNKELNYLDFSLWMFAAASGKVAKLFINTATYRSLQNSATHSLDICKKWKLKKAYFTDFNIIKKSIEPDHHVFLEKQEYLRAKSFYLFAAHCRDFDFYETFLEIFRKKGDFYRYSVQKVIKQLPIMGRFLYTLRRAKLSLLSKSIFNKKSN